MADNMNDDMVMDLDLNQEPPPFGYDPLITDLETTHSRIEDRLRQLEAVSARARQRQRWRQARNIPELSYTTVIEPHVDTGNPNTNTNSKRDISQLAKALSMDMDSNNTDNNNKDGGDEDDDGTGGFFDCYICLETARDPILTCCGHLFCWCCFYQLSYVDSNAKECPVCKGEVTDSSITPIYGNGRNRPVLKLESGVKIPPRPHARRVDCIKQQGLEAGGSGGRRHHARQFSRVIPETDSSLSSVSSALNNAERLVEDLETYFRSDRLLRRTDTQRLPNNVINVQPEPQNAEMSAVEIDNSRRSNVSRVLSLEGVMAREIRRRRLR